MNQESSSSGAINSSFENISDVFTSYSEIPSEGFNCLYKAQRYGKWFVLKGLKPEYRIQTFYLELLTKEFELGVKMEHPHIAHTFSKENDPVAGPCIVMEYVDGVTLREFLAEKPDARTRLKIVRELLSAMAYYHSLQIIHRDLKPDNILITRNGHNVKLIDFGLADSDYHGVLKQPAGSNRYAAPEQVAGDVPIDLRADLYAFGVILPQIFPHRYRAIARKCTRSDREQRFRNAGEILQRLQRRRVLVPGITAAVGIVAVVGIMAFLVPHIQSVSKNETQSETADSVAQKPLQPVNVKDTVVAVVSDIPEDAMRLIDTKLDSVYSPAWKWFRAVTADDSGIDSAKAYAILRESLDRTPPYSRERHTKIVNEVVKQYPACASQRWKLEQYVEQSNLNHHTDFSGAVLAFWEAKKKAVY